MAGNTYNVTQVRAQSQCLSLQETAQGFTNKYKILAADLAVATATGFTDVISVTLGALPAKWKVRAAGININTAVAGTTALTVVVGTTTTTNAFITSQSVLTAGWLSGVPALTSALVTATATASMVAVFTNATSGSPSAITAGDLDIYLAIDDDRAGSNG